MRTTEILTNLIFMQGHRLVVMGEGDYRQQHSIRGDVGNLFSDDEGALPVLSEFMEMFSHGQSPMTILWTKQDEDPPIVYRFLPIGGAWMPLDEDQVRIHIAGKIRDFVPGTMTND